MAATEWWQRGPVPGVHAMLQPVAHIILQIGESVHEIVEPLTEAQWKRTFVHPVLGPRRLEETLALYAWHGTHHIAHITNAPL